METTRARFGSAIEWLLATVFIVAAVGVVSIVVRELRTIGAVPAMARESAALAAPVPAGVPARAVSVPVLILPGKKEVRVGDTVSAVAARLGRDAEIGSQVVERSRFGDRLTRFYEHAGTRFVLVFEPFEAAGQPKVASIYLQ
jgi:hypothetical protein